MKFVVCVTFKINPEHWDAFLERMKENAATSQSLEEGCLQFDVCTDDTRPHEVFLYEVYTSPRAFDAHLQSDHFKQFDQTVANMIEDKVVMTYSTVHQFG